jgi:hypothetical protein
VTTVTTWILIIAGALLAAAGLLVRMRPVFKATLAVVGVLVLLAGLWMLVSGNAISFGPAPGKGTSKADTLYTAARPAIGETVFTPNPEDTATYLWDRIAAAANADPGLKFTASETMSGGIVDSEKLVFADGSSLTLTMSSVGGDPGLTLESVRIARP